MKHALPFDIYSPFSLGLPFLRCLLRSLVRQIGGGLVLVEVPVQRDPEHHGYLPARARRRLEVIAGRVGDRGYKEAVVLQGRSFEGMDMAALVSWIVAGHLFRWLVLWEMVLVVVFRLYYDGPASREDAAVDAELVGLEEEAAKDRNDSEILAIRQVYNRRSGRHAS